MRATPRDARAAQMQRGCARAQCGRRPFLMLAAPLSATPRAASAALRENHPSFIDVTPALRRRHAAAHAAMPSIPIRRATGF